MGEYVRDDTRVTNHGCPEVGRLSARAPGMGLRVTPPRGPGLHRQAARGRMMLPVMLYTWRTRPGRSAPLPVSSGAPPGPGRYLSHPAERPDRRAAPGPSK
jgi:hypothetical protein